MPLHTEYRPNNFDEFIGNHDTVSALKDLLGRGDRPHTYLFTGPAGAGKTSLARIMAKELGCMPSGLSEINAADTRGIDTAREIISSSHFKPMQGAIRAFIIDEAHAATGGFASALLKPLEEPPSHVYFFLCTTDPQKLLATIKSRCTKFEVQKLSNMEMDNLISWVCECESKELSPDVKGLIISVTEGCPREALVLLDQVINLPREEAIEIVKNFVPEEQKVIDLCLAILKHDSWSKITSIYTGLTEDAEKVRRAILGFFNSQLIKKGSDSLAATIAIFEGAEVWNSGKPALTRMIWDATQIHKGGK